MKRVWQCEFCRDTDTSMEKMDKHEQSCRYNVANKTCTTCDHQEPMDYSMDYECGIHDLGFYIDVDDGDKRCNDWINKEEKTKKLKKIVEIINENK